MLDLSEAYFAVLAGLVYGAVFYSFHPYARPRVMVISLSMIWLTFILLQNLNRFLEGDPQTWKQPDPRD